MGVAGERAASCNKEAGTYLGRQGGSEARHLAFPCFSSFKPLPLPYLPLTLGRMPKALSQPTFPLPLLRAVPPQPYTLPTPSISSEDASPGALRPGTSGGRGKKK